MMIAKWIMHDNDNGGWTTTRMTSTTMIMMMTTMVMMMITMMTIATLQTRTCENNDDDYVDNNDNYLSTAVTWRPSFRRQVLLYSNEDNDEDGDDYFSKLQIPTSTVTVLVLYQPRTMSCSLDHDTWLVCIFIQPSSISSIHLHVCGHEFDRLLCPSCPQLY